MGLAASLKYSHLASDFWKGGVSMSEPYLCPSCGTNRTWFNKIKQLAVSTKLDPETGEMVEEFADGEGLPPFAFRYNGPEYKVQCGICGLIDDEERFIKTAQHSPRTVRS